VSAIWLVGLVDADRDGAHAVRNHRRQAGAGLLRRELRRENRLALDHRDDQAATDDLLRLRERTFGRLAGREGEDLQVVRLQLGAERQVDRRDDDGLRRRGHGLDRLVLHHVVRAVRESASGEDGDGEHGEDSVAHWTFPSRRSAYPRAP
jgi:hypothetical protein